MIKYNIIDYENKNFICDKHNEKYTIYCKKCKKNVSLYCLKENDNHKLTNYGNILSNLDNLKIKMKELKERINLIKKDIKKMINLLNKIMENIDCYYNINIDIINN